MTDPLAARPLAPAALRDAQAAACLAAADAHRAPLLRLARRLAGSADAGWDLYQDALLHCHDAIQRKGFVGADYAPYLFRALRTAHFRQHERSRRFTAWPEGYEAPAEPEGDAEARQRLAEQVHAAREQLAWPDRLALRLHLDGHSFQDISALVGGGDQSWIRRRVEKTKARLRAAFAPAWAALCAG